jgi:hypothetical protein
LEAIPGVAVGTSRLAIVRNVDQHLRRPSPESRDAADPLPSPPAPPFSPTETTSLGRTISF